MEEASSRVLRALAEPPHVFLVDDRAGGDAAGVESTITRAGLWGLVVKVKLTEHITAYYVDLAKIERLCLYEECASRDRSEQDACVSSCLERKLRGLAALAGDAGGGG